MKVEDSTAERFEHLAGHVGVLIPLSWRIINYGLLSITLAVFTFLFLANYSRVVTVDGIIVPDKGVAAIVPYQAGVLSELHVRDGDFVRKGAGIAQIRVERDLDEQTSTSSLTASAIERQDQNLSSQIAESEDASKAEISEIRTRRAGVTDVLVKLRSQMSLQEELIATAKQDLANATEIAKRGFVSKQDIQNRQERLLSRQQQLFQLEQSVATQESALEEANRSMSQVASRTRSQSAGINASRAQLAQQAAVARGDSSYVIRAPLSGVISAVTVRLGQVVTPQAPMMSIIPAGSRLRAELAIPPRAIGFVKPGQEVHLALDSFPYQQFGSIKGVVRTVARSAVTQQSATGQTSTVFPVTVDITTDHILAYGQKQRLLSGMTLTARVKVETQSLLQWLFDPILSLNKR
ncbi:HlyD family efflux transporter periplasmic adaptor subunit [Sphingomonas aurantiaca]|uniref:HlyD family efflux transporter periplasmic adaptor subunit n=1 Tax=Sphingomonas aurantiaca TaxID=185949 RepID=UPI002FDFED9F